MQNYRNCILEPPIWDFELPKKPDLPAKVRHVVHTNVHSKYIKRQTKEYDEKNNDKLMSLNIMCAFNKIMVYKILDISISIKCVYPKRKFLKIEPNLNESPLLPHSCAFFPRHHRSL